MKLARVIGNVVSTIKQPAYHNVKLLAVQPLNLSLEPEGRAQPAIDTVGAGAGELVVVVEEGKAARDVLKDPRAPVRTLIVGIVDRLDLSEEAV